MTGARGFVGRLLFGLAVLAIVLLLVDVSAAWNTLAGLSPPLLVLALACLLSTRFVVGFKWWLLFGGRRAGVSYPVVQRAILLADYQALLLPNTLAADALRLALLRHHERGITYVASTIAADRVVNVMVAAAMALAGMLVLLQLPAGADIAPSVSSTVIVAAAALLAAGFAVQSDRLFQLAVGSLRRLIGRGPLRVPVTKLCTKAVQLHKSMAAVLAEPSTLAKVVLLSVLTVCMRLATIYCLFAAVGSLPGLLPVLAIYPIIMLFVLLPVSILGIGVQDGAFVFFFGGIGIAASTSLAVSIAFYATLILCSLTAGILAFLTGPPMPTAAALPASERPPSGGPGRADQEVSSA